MSAASVCKGLSVDPGVQYLAQLLDALQAQVNECCGGSGLTGFKAQSGKSSTDPAADAKKVAGIDNPIQPTAQPAAQPAGTNGPAAEHLAEVIELREKLADAEATIQRLQRAASGEK